MDRVQDVTRQVNDAVGFIAKGVRELQELGFDREEVQSEIENVMEEEFAPPEKAPTGRRKKPSRK